MEFLVQVMKIPGLLKARNPFSRMWCSAPRTPTLHTRELHHTEGVLKQSTDPLFHARPFQVVCFLPPDSVPTTAGTPSPRQWLLFDSHPRPQLGLAGASIRSFAGEDELVEALNVTFPAIDLGTDNVMASMYNMFDCVPLSMKNEEER